MKKGERILFVVPLVIAALFALLNALGALDVMEMRLYDTLLHVKPPIEQHQSLVLLNIDDDAIANVGIWPWSRDVVADGLILMREFETGYAILDIEYVERSPLGVDSELLQREIPGLFTREFAGIRQSILDLFSALASGAISVEDAQDFVFDLADITDQTQDRLLATVRDIARDNDEYFGKAARFNGRTFFTVNMLPQTDPAVSEELLRYTRERFTVPNTTTELDTNVPFRSAGGIRPTILPIIRHGIGAGFPNVVIDRDGVRRRVELLFEHNGDFFGQLALAPLLHWLGQPELQVREGQLVLIDAEYPDGEVHTVRIPMVDNSRILINWPRATFDDSFRHVSFWELTRNTRLEENLLHNLRAMADAGYLSFYDAEFDILQAYDYAEQIKEEVMEGADRDLIEEYRFVRDMMLVETGRFLDDTTEQAILDEINRILAVEDLPAGLREDYAPLLDEVPELFAAARANYRLLMQSRETLRQELPGAFAFIGFTGTGTTDIGVNPFEEQYMNVGTHASVANTILQRRFLTVLSPWYSVAAAFVLALLVTFLVRRLEPLWSIIVGLLFVLLISAAGALFFVYTGNYLPLITPSLTVFLSFLVLTLVKFLQTAHERSFIRSAFGHYLSTDVINELLDDPTKLKLGGEKKHLTAFFTDVKGFSGISEQLDPTDLVRLLNSYLTEMSNIILDLRGTIDKYEGDAIISFFGAPISYQDHAARACRAAVLMKRAEARLNEQVLEQGLSPAPLLTRIGINTGEMVVGNMGTAQKMDYTMMGHAVNLAARLEGVNKQYGTWLLASEMTRAEAGDDFAFRMMDRVRVVGVTEPVRLFELVEESGHLDERTREVLDIYHDGLRLFEQRDWNAAGKRFEQALKAHPGDGPSQVYIKRCREFLKKQPPADWDGAFNLTQK
ncbi:MAG: CHASE2 domain-containing protein [Spirochaetaceae bacterium]|nr:MAG: CHASE2 domain-containing protein [Spirochaetaceae bacterium]